MKLHLKIRCWEVAREKSRAKAVALALVAVAAVGVATWIWIRTSIDRRWTRMEQRIQELHAATVAHPSDRPVLSGSAVPGDAWGDYSTALAEDFQDIRTDRDLTTQTLQKHAGALEALRRGARKSACRPAVEWSQGVDFLHPSGLPARKLIHLAICRARILREADRLGEAVDLLLEGCQFARDFGSNTPPSVEGWTYLLLVPLLQELELHLRLEKAVRLPEIDRAMELLHQTLPAGELTVRNRVLSWGFTFLSEGGRLGEKLRVPPPGWNELYSWRLRLAAAFEDLDEFVRKDPTDARWRSLMESTRNPVTRQVLEDVWSASPARIQARIHARMLRIAAHWRATGETLEVEERPGVRFQMEERNGVLSIRSAARRELSLEVRR